MSIIGIFLLANWQLVHMCENVFSVVKWWLIIYINVSGKHLVLVTDPEKGDYAFDNLGFRG